MKPIKSKKIESEVEIICPDCDGEGKEIPVILTNTEQTICDIPQSCSTCKGTGKVKGKIVKQ